MKHDPLFEFERTSLERLKLAAEVILAEVRDYSQLAMQLGEPPESGKCDDLIPSPLEAELVIFRVIFSSRVSQCCDLGRPVVDSVADGTLAA